MTAKQICPASLQTRLEEIHRLIAAACLKAGRAPEEVQLLAVGKGHPPGAIQALHELGQRAFGESYVDEASRKIEDLQALEAEWHMIGPIQSNKTRIIAEHFDWVQSVDRLRIARRLNNQRPEGQPPLKVLIQVNLDEEPQKSGCLPQDIPALAEQITAFPQLELRGLMAIPALRQGLDEQRAAFARLRQLFAELKRSYPAVDTLSAGMSGDMEAAILEGSTMVRVGSALFGPRPAT